MNAGCHATLSWRAHDIVCDTLVTPGQRLTAFIQIPGLSNLDTLAIRIVWGSDHSPCTFVAVPDSSCVDCAYFMPATSSTSFRGEAAYDWTSVPRTNSQTCIALGFETPPNAAPATRICAPLIICRDSDGGSDFIPISNTLSINGGGDVSCPVAVYGVGADNSSLTISGNELDRVSSLKVRSMDGQIVDAQIESASDHLLQASLPLSGSISGCTIVALDDDASGDSLQIGSSAPEPMINVAVAYTYPNMRLPGYATPPWSPQGGHLALYNDDGLFIATPSVSGDTLTRVLCRVPSDIRWDRTGTWLLARVPTNPFDAHSLNSLVAIHVTTRDTVTLTERTDFSAFSWRSEGTVSVWSSLAGGELQLPAPTTYSPDTSAAWPWPSTLISDSSNVLRTLIVGPANGDDYFLSAQGSKADQPTLVYSRDAESGAYLGVFIDSTNYLTAAIVAADGMLIRRLDEAYSDGFTPVSFSGGGALVLGSIQATSSAERVAAFDRPANHILPSTLPIGCQKPQGDPASALIAIEDPALEAVHVGILTLN